MWQDLRYAVRMLGKHRAFTAVAAVVLALGFGINTALFSIVYHLFYKPLPVHAPHELAYLYWIVGVSNRRPMPMPVVDFEYLRDHSDVFAGMTAHLGDALQMTADDQTELVRGERVYSNYFELLGVKPALGRTLRSEEDEPSGTDPAIVISHELWRRRFSGDQAVLGKTVRLTDAYGRDRIFTIVGVAGRGFTGVSDPWTPSEFWVTFAQATAEPRRYSVAPIGRLRPNVTLAQARAATTVLAADIRRTLPHRDDTEYVMFAANDVRMPFDPDASVVPARLTAALTVVVLVVLFIAATNITGLLLARGVTRAGETAVRMVVGASRWRIARQSIAESTALSGVGGAVGLLLAVWLLALFRRYTPGRHAVDVALSPQVIAMAAVMCVGVGIAIGLVPAVRLRRVDLMSALPGSGMAVTSHVRSRLRHTVVIPQVGLSLVLLLVAAVHVRALLTIELSDLGYDTTSVVVLNIGYRREPPEQDQRAATEKRADKSRAFYRQLMSRLEDVPGAASAALASGLPLHGISNTNFTAVSQERFFAGDARGIGTSLMAVSPGYFRTMGMSLLAGRDFDERDTRTTPRVAVVSESLATRLWPGRDPLGRFIAARNNFPGPNEKIDWLEVVGLVNEIDPILRDTGSSPFIYVSNGQEWLVSSGRLIARVHGDPGTAVRHLKDAVSASDPFAQVYRITTVEQLVAEILYPRRLAAAILGAAAFIGLLLASIGLYGVVSYSVAQRTQEFGIRAALGADRRAIMRLVLRDGVQVIVLGSIVGAIASYAAIRITGRIFAGAPGLDVVTGIVAPLALALVVLAACYLPARRSARQDPMQTLREL